MNKKIIIASSVGALVIGVLFFLIYNNRIAINFRFGHSLPDTSMLVRSEKRPVTIWFWAHRQMKNDQRELLWSTSPVFNATNVINSWLAILDQEEVIAQPAAIQDVSLSGDEQELIVSWDRPPFNHDDATYDKVMLVESLLKTLRGCECAVQRVRFLVQHQPINDMHLDFSKPWPINGFVEAQAYPDIDQNCLSPREHDLQTPVTIVLDPAGDARLAGRVIGDSYERSLTFQCMDAVKDYLESHFKTVRIVVTRLPGETVEPLQNAAFANRIKADLFISLSMYPVSNKMAEVSVFYHALNPGAVSASATDPSERRLALKPYNDALEQYHKASYCVAAFIDQYIAQTYQHENLKVNKVLGIPCKQLSGIMAPAVVLEIGLTSKNDVAVYAEYVSHALENCIKSFKIY